MSESNFTTEAENIKMLEEMFSNIDKEVIKLIFYDNSNESLKLDWDMDATIEKLINYDQESNKEEKPVSNDRKQKAEAIFDLGEDDHIDETMDDIKQRSDIKKKGFLDDSEEENDPLDNCPSVFIPSKKENSDDEYDEEEEKNEEEPDDEDDNDYTEIKQPAQKKIDKESEEDQKSTKNIVDNEISNIMTDYISEFQDIQNQKVQDVMLEIRCIYLIFIK